MNMSKYSNKITIDGVMCGMIVRGSNGRYMAIFERELVSLEAIEGIHWEKPTIVGESVLPVGYGFEVVDIQYARSEGDYKVYLQVAKQYLGDVTEYVDQVAELKEQVATLTAQVEALTAEEEPEEDATEEDATEEDATEEDATEEDATEEDAPGDNGEPGDAAE
jgi:hypothetical protein